MLRVIERQEIEVAGVKFISLVVEGVPSKELKAIADDLKKQIGSGIVVVVGMKPIKADKIPIHRPSERLRESTKLLVDWG